MEKLQEKLHIIHVKACFIGVAAIVSHLAFAGPYVYVSEMDENNISIIDAKTNSVVETISTGQRPADMAFTPDGAKMYVTMYGENAVYAYDTISKDHLKTIIVGPQPDGVEITPDGTKAYIVNTTCWNCLGSVSVIDLSTNTVVSNIPVGIAPHDVVFSPDGSRAYVTNTESWNVSVIDTSTNTILTNIPVGIDPYYLTITPDGTRLYVVNHEIGAWSVSVINTTTNSVIATIPVGQYPEKVAISPDGAYAYVTNGNSASVSVISTASNSIVDTINVGNNPRGIAFIPDGKLAYVTNNNDDTVSVIDTSTKSVVATISVGDSPRYVTSKPVMYNCQGATFLPPLSQQLTINNKSKAAIPVKMTLKSIDGSIVDDTMIAPPVIQVSYNGSIGSGITGYDSDLLPPGLSDDGNEFRYDEDNSMWIINLGMKTYTASGTYTITAIPGNPNYYLSGCIQNIIRNQ